MAFKGNRMTSRSVAKGSQGSAAGREKVGRGGLSPRTYLGALAASVLVAAGLFACSESPSDTPPSPAVPEADGGTPTPAPTPGPTVKPPTETISPRDGGAPKPTDGGAPVTATDGGNGAVSTAVFAALCPKVSGPEDLRGQLFSEFSNTFDSTTNGAREAEACKVRGFVETALTDTQESSKWNAEFEPWVGALIGCTVADTRPVPTRFAAVPAKAATTAMTKADFDKVVELLVAAAAKASGTTWTPAMASALRQRLEAQRPASARAGTNFTASRCTT